MCIASYAGILLKLFYAEIVKTLLLEKLNFHRNALAVGADLVGELTTLPQTPQSAKERAIFEFFLNFRRS